MLAFALICSVAGVSTRYLALARVVGGSMSPGLTTGDLTVVARRATVGPGDIVLVDSPGRGRIMHRVVTRDAAGGLRIKGDANPTPDLESVAPTDIVGRMVLRVPVGALLAHMASAVPMR